MDWD
jgi:hypothetical protein